MGRLPSTQTSWSPSPMVPEPTMHWKLIPCQLMTGRYSHWSGTWRFSRWCLARWSLPSNATLCARRAGGACWLGEAHSTSCTWKGQMHSFSRRSNASARKQPPTLSRWTRKTLIGTRTHTLARRRYVCCSVNATDQCFAQLRSRPFKHPNAIYSLVRKRWQFIVFKVFAAALRLTRAPTLV